MKNRIQKRMEELGITSISGLARKCGLATTSISYEKNLNNIGLVNLKKLLKGLECSFEYLVYGEENQSTKLEYVDKEVEPSEECTIEAMDDSMLLDLFARCSAQYDVLNLESICVYDKVKNELLNRLNK